MNDEKFVVQLPDGMAPLADWCDWHHRVEPLRPGDFKACFECGHVWRTKVEFEAECQWAQWEAGVAFDLDQPFCPLCIHDF